MIVIDITVLPPEYQDVRFSLIGASPEEIRVVKETGKLFGTVARLESFHYLVSRGEEFVGVLEYTVRPESKNGTAVVTGFWINSNHLLPFLQTVYLNLGLNFDTVNLKGDTGEMTIISNGTPLLIDPLSSSAIRLLNIEQLPDGRLRSLLDIPAHKKG